MGCNTCKQSKQSNVGVIDNVGEEQTVSLLPDNLYDGTFLFKVVAFFAIVIAIPFILLILIGQVFLAFFFPKSLPKASDKFKQFFMGIFKKYAEFKLKRSMKQREKQFKKTVDYVNDTIEEVEIYDNESKNDE
jgi:Sec-independent protein translocase protein TatA